jgi:hypothetical protein
MLAILRHSFCWTVIASDVVTVRASDVGGSKVAGLAAVVLEMGGLVLVAGKVVERG